MACPSDAFDGQGFVKCVHVDQATNLCHCDHCNFNFCDVCVPDHKQYLISESVKASSTMLPETPSLALSNKLKHASQFLDEDMFLVKQQIASAIDAVVERFSSNLWAQGSKLLAEAEEKVASEKLRLKSVYDGVDMELLDTQSDDLKIRLRNLQGQDPESMSFEQLATLSKDIKCHTQLEGGVDNVLNVGHRVRVTFELNTELENVVQSFDALKLGNIGLSQSGVCIPLTRMVSESTDASYGRVTLMSTYHGSDAFGDSLYLPHAVSAIPDSHMVAVLHGEYRLSIMSCGTMAPMCVLATYHLQHPVNAPGSLPLHYLAADKTKLYIIGDGRLNIIVTVPIDTKFQPNHQMLVPRTFAKSWSDHGFRGLAIGHKTRWLYTADGDTIAAYSLDSAVPTFRRIGTFPSDFLPCVFDVFPDGVTLVYTSKANRNVVYWRSFPVGEDTRKSAELIKSSRHYINHREANFGGVSVDCFGNIVLCDDRSLQVFYRYSVDLPVSTFPLPLCHEDANVTSHSADVRGIAVLSAGINVDMPMDNTTFKESCASFVAVADCAAHRVMLFKISG